MCHYRDSHLRPECRLAKAHAEKGWVVSKADRRGGPRRLPQIGSGSRLARATELAVQTIAQAASVTVASVGRPSDKRRDTRGRKTSVTPLANTRVRHVYADSQSNTVTDLANMAAGTERFSSTTWSGTHRRNSKQSREEQ